MSKKYLASLAVFGVLILSWPTLGDASRLADLHIMSDSAPQRYLTRAELAHIVTKAYLGQDFKAPLLPPFRDVPVDEWYATSVAVLKEQGMINGYPDQTFRPAEYVTRAEMYKMVLRTAHLRLRPDPVFPARDLPRTAWYTPYLTTAVALDILNPSQIPQLNADGSVLSLYVYPHQLVTRAELSQILLQLENQGEASFWQAPSVTTTTTTTTTPTPSSANSTGPTTAPTTIPNYADSTNVEFDNLVIDTTLEPVRIDKIKFVNDSAVVLMGVSLIYTDPQTGQEVIRHVPTSGSNESYFQHLGLELPRYGTLKIRVVAALKDLYNAAAIKNRYYLQIPNAGAEATGVWSGEKINWSSLSRQTTVYSDTIVGNTNRDARIFTVQYAGREFSSSSGERVFKFRVSTHANSGDLTLYRIRFNFNGTFAQGQYPQPQGTAPQLYRSGDSTARGSCTVIGADLTSLCSLEDNINGGSTVTYELRADTSKIESNESLAVNIGLDSAPTGSDNFVWSGGNGYLIEYFPINGESFKY